jgi:hypothetical protein
MPGSVQLKAYVQAARHGTLNTSPTGTRLDMTRRPGITNTTAGHGALVPRLSERAKLPTRPKHVGSVDWAKRLGAVANSDSE